MHRSVDKVVSELQNNRKNVKSSLAVFKHLTWFSCQRDLWRLAQNYEDTNKRNKNVILLLRKETCNTKKANQEEGKKRTQGCIPSPFMLDLK